VIDFIALLDNWNLSSGFVLLKLNPNIESKGKHPQKYFVLQISMDRAKLLTQKLLKQGYVSPMLS
jgi:hypothetical protein